ncbi:GNAT family N-acetyltransferase [Microbacterium sp. NPDC090225]|uniref:GNAT family N-acetyltransferase n=1 Tax=Microbacterium sp. NPDC090225 TaxID=3364207 RepID=UPI00380E4F87
MFRLDPEHTLRPVRAGDGAALVRAYAVNRAHLAPWEPARSEEFFTEAWQERDVRRTVDEAQTGRSIRFVVTERDGRIVGRTNLNGIVRGPFLSGDLGYWIAADAMRRGLATRAVTAVLEHARDSMGLHRVQAATLLHNAASQRVLAANGFTRIGIAPRYLEIAGEWQDHVLFQRLLEERITAPSERP